MPKTDIDYSNTIIYKITCKDKTITDVYVGHTTNFVQRKHAHKQNCINIKSSNHTCKLYQFIRANGGWPNWKMDIINFYDCADHYAARKKEQEHFIELKATLNAIEPFPEPKITHSNNVEENIILTIKSTLDCSTCNIKCSSLQSFNNHIKTNKHQKLLNLCSTEEKDNTSNIKFACELCNYKTVRHSQYIRHLKSNKHLSYSNNPKKPDSSHNKYNCDKCNTEYKSRSGLWRHKHKCNITLETNKVDHPIEHSLINKILFEVIKTNAELIKQNHDIQKQMMDFAKNMAH